MPYLQNPFKIRASEHVNQTSNLYLRLFGPHILTSKKLHNRNILDNIVFIRSSPGGGKTTLLRLFTPPSLLTLHRHSDKDEFKELWNILNDIGAIDVNGPKVVGVYIRFSPTYPSIEDLDGDNNNKNRLLFSLLNARIILSTLKSLSEIKNLKFPDDLDKLVFEKTKDSPIDFNGSSSLSGDILYKQAVEIENSICGVLDSISPEFNIGTKDNNNIFFDLLYSANILIDGKPIDEKLVLLFDDFHKLTIRQRDILLEILIEKRPTYGIWIAERYQRIDFETIINNSSSNFNEEEHSFGSLKPYILDRNYNEPELISGAKSGRDYETVIHLEKMWNSKSFEKNVMYIANRRLVVAKDLNTSNFEDLLESSLKDVDYHKKYSKAIETISHRIIEKIGTSSKYNEWIGMINEIEATSKEKALEWRNLEIIIERDIGKKQKTLVDLIDTSLSQEEFETRRDTSIMSIADFHLANEFNLPYYFGMELLAQLAHFNIEQFLSISGRLFDEIRAKYQIKRNASLTPRRQHEIIKQSANEKWDEIVNGIAYTRQTRLLLEGIGSFLKKETINPKASYLGVTGIGIKMRDIDILTKRDNYKILRHTIRTCLANNLLEAREITQGGERYLVLYLNRILCVKFNLHLTYGGWRHKKLNELQIWIEGRKR